MKKPIPSFATDEEAQAFVDTADLSTYDLSAAVPVRFELPLTSARLELTVPKPLLEAVKARADAEGLSTPQYIEKVLDAAVNVRPN